MGRLDRELLQTRDCGLCTKSALGAGSEESGTAADW